MIIRFGMLATDAYGKAGGQCIQRRGSIRVMRNITIPTQRIASQQNHQRRINSKLFSAWAYLPQTTRDSWATVATFLSTKNGWGEDRTLSGREAFTRLNSIRIAMGKDEILPTSVIFNIPLLDMDPMEISATDQTFKIPVLYQEFATYYQVKALRIRTLASNPLIPKLKTISYLVELSDSTDNYEKLVENFGAFVVGDFISIAIRPISDSGITGVWIQQSITVD